MMLGSFSIISVLAQAQVIAEHKNILTISMRRKRTPSATHSHNNHIGCMPPKIPNKKNYMQDILINNKNDLTVDVEIKIQTFR